MYTSMCMCGCTPFPSSWSCSPPTPPPLLLRGLLELWYQKQHPSVLHWTHSFACICICICFGSIIYALRGQHANRYVKVSPYFIGLDRNDVWGQAECMAGALFLVNPVCLLSYQNFKLKTLWGLWGEVERFEGCGSNLRPWWQNPFISQFQCPQKKKKIL